MNFLINILCLFYTFLCVHFIIVHTCNDVYTQTYNKSISIEQFNTLYMIVSFVINLLLKDYITFMHITHYYLEVTNYNIFRV